MKGFYLGKMKLTCGKVSSRSRSWWTTILAFGQRTLYVVSAFLYSLICIPVAPTIYIATVFICRFVTGFLFAVTSIVIFGSMEHLIDTEGRIRAVSIWLLVSDMGVVIGSIFACYIGSRCTELVSLCPSGISTY